MTQPQEQAPPTTPQTPTDPAGYGPPRGHGPQPGYGPPPGYGAPAGYGPPPAGYGYPVAYAAPVEPPGRTLGIVGFILAFFFSVAGIVVSAIARKQSRDAGVDNPLATWGLILSIVFTAIGALFLVAYFALLGQIFMLAGVAAY